MARTLSGLVVLVAAVASSAAFAQRAPAAGPAAAASVPAEPQETQRQHARELFRQGNTMLDQGNYLEALRLFEQAFSAFPNPKIHFNLAQTLSELGRPLESLRHYEQFVADVRRDEDPLAWNLANERIFRLQSSIAVVLLQANVVEAQVTLDGTVVGTTPLSQPVRINPGPHAIVVAKAGYDRFVVEFVARPGEVVTKRVRLLTEEEGAATKRAVKAAEAQRLWALEQERRAKAKLQRQRRLLRTSGWSAVGAGIGAVVLGGVFAGLSVRERNQVQDAPQLTPWTSVSGHYHDADTYRKVCYYSVATGAGVAIAGAALVWWSYRGGAAERAPNGPVPVGRGVLTALPTVGPQGAGLVVQGRF